MKSIFITGASSGLGFAITRFFAGKGYKVFATARNLSSELEALLSKNVVFQALDVTHSEDCKEAARQCQSHFEHIDVVINNASGMTGGKLVGAYDSTEIEHEIMLTLSAPIQISNIVLELRAKSNSRKHIDLFFLSSSSALIGKLGNEEYPLYAAAKAGLIRFADCINAGEYHPSVSAHTLIPHNIRENNFIEENAASFNDVCRVIEFALSRTDNLVIPRYEIEPKTTNA